MPGPRTWSLKALLPVSGHGDHLSRLTGLWVSSAVSAGANFATTFLLLAFTTPTVFAAYIVGLTVQQLSSTWVDGGLSAALQIITTPNAQSSMPPGVAWVALNKLRWMRSTIAIICLFLLLAAINLIGSTTLNESDYLAIGLFACAGFLDANSNFRGALLYSQGQFRRFSAWQIVSPTGRLLMVSGLALLGIELTATNIALAVLFMSAVSFGFAAIVTAHIVRGVHDVEDAKTSRDRLAALATPLGVGAYVDSLTHHLSVIAASAIAQPMSLAIFGAFQRINQIYAIASNPLLQYFGRTLRQRGEIPNKHDLELRLLKGVAVLYLVFALTTFVLYVCLSKWMSHYALNHLWAFAVFLTGNLSGALLAAINQILYARGFTRHRLVGPFLMLLIGVSAWLAFTPTALEGVVWAHAAPILATAIYYGWCFRRVLSQNPK